MKNCKDCIWYGKEKPDQCGNYLCRNQSEYDPRFGIEGEREKEAASDYIKRADVLELVMRGKIVSNRNYKSVMRLIMGIPAADVRPVVHGKWEIYFISTLDGEGCKCSECGFEGVPYWDYCPNCWADMREES